MYKISISMPTGELLVGEGDHEPSEIPAINGMHLNVRFDRQVGKLVVKGTRANLRLRDFTVFDTQDVTTERLFVDSPMAEAATNMFTVALLMRGRLQ
jgi:hypothetical protein